MMDLEFVHMINTHVYSNYIP